jgi:hypothetical protein
MKPPGKLIVGLGLGVVVLSVIYLRRARAATGSSFSGPAEDFDAGDSEDGCDPTPKPGVVKFRDWVLRTWGGYDVGIVRACDDATRTNPSGHKLGRAWDWGTLAPGTPGVPGGFTRKADVDAAIGELLAHDAELFRRAGLTYLIWNRQIWSARTKSWQAYHGVDDHTTHVHFSFGPRGGAGTTSLYTGI